MRSLKKWMVAVAVISFLLGGQAFAQQEKNTRDQIRRQLGQLLDSVGPKINIVFRQHQETQWTYVGILTERLIYANRMEVYLVVDDKENISFEIFPLYNNKYINLDKVKDSGGLMRRMLKMNYNGFFYWGADKENDIFAGFTITLESGFPAEAIEMVLKSVHNLDKTVGEWRPLIDGSSGK
jgi:hypothetical protein